MSKTEDTKVQDNKVDGKPESEMHADSKPAEGAEPSERTRKEFEKLTQKNKEMAEKLSAYEARSRENLS